MNASFDSDHPSPTQLAWLFVPAVMPSIDYVAMSDRELSDVVACIRSMPKVDKTMAPLKIINQRLGGTP